MADSRLFFIAVPRSFPNNHFLFSLCFDRAQPRTVDLRLPQVTDVRLYVTQQLSIGTFTATLHLRHVERSEVQDTAAAHAYVMADLLCHPAINFTNSYVSKNVKLQQADFLINISDILKTLLHKC